MIALPSEVARQTNGWKRACRFCFRRCLSILTCFHHARWNICIVHETLLSMVWLWLELISLVLRQIMLNYLRLTLVECHSQVDAAGSEGRPPQSSICGGLPTLRPRQKSTFCCKETWTLCVRIETRCYSIYFNILYMGNVDACGNSPWIQA